ncbi:pentapeptide repeat-containing protein [Actinomadura graeca]|uniref:Pentapeptide repeat-containing protein n=1 Tax=Actinomadura graeca TaxID=2750812 RepID=A0ABX8R4A3_9ACTN|nr:pentapeptide repeat-containing protein [Actinomadura graeca]QXJ25906.1 pentapeptide repeat-containing protein [Actinomadura graeca]
MDESGADGPEEGDGVGGRAQVQRAAAAPGGRAVAAGPRWAGRAARAALVAGGVLVALMVVWVLGPGARWWLVHVDGVKVGGKGGLTGKDLADALDTVRGRAMALGTGLLAAVAIYYTASNASSARRSAQAAIEGVQAARRSAEATEAAQLRTFELTQQGQRQSDEAQRRTHELTEEGQRRTHELTERGQNTDRFSAAVAHLGDPTPAVQLGGVHALAGLADDAPTREFRQTCIDVLCAFLRLPYDPDPGNTPADGQDPAGHAAARTAYRAIREVRHTIIRTIGNHLRDGAPISWRGHDLDFTDVVFDGGDFHDTVFTDASISFQTARFVDASISFQGARFEDCLVDFGGARFAGGAVDFRAAHFAGGTVTFEFAQFAGGTVTFGGARFAGGAVDFGGARFVDGLVTFGDARFVDGLVTFGDARFKGGTVNFRHARFEGGAVTFGDARFAGGAVDFGNARFAGGAVGFRYAVFEGGRVNFGDAAFEGGAVSFESANGRRPHGLPDGMAEHLS